MSWLLAAVTAVTPAVTPAPAPTPTPAPASETLRLDVDKHVIRLLDGDESLPRFETQIEVLGQTPQEAVQRHLHDGALECGPTPGGAPTVVEMREGRETPPPEAISFVAVAAALINELQKLKGPGPDRFFVYRMLQRGRVSFFVHEGRLPLEQLVRPDAVLEPVAGFPDRDTATRAWRRLERGYSTPMGPEATPPPPWAVIHCGYGRK